MTDDLDYLAELMAVIESRRDDPLEESYVSRLLAEGPAAVRAKVAEESEELLDASRDEPADAVVHEAADVVFHVLVLLAAHDLDLEDVTAELQRRRRHEAG